MRIDHLVWAAPALEPACALFEQMTGVTPELGGVHGHGLSHNALVALGPRCYLEIYAPLPGKTDGDDWVRACAALTTPRMFAICVDAGDHLDAVCAAMREAGLDGEGPHPWSRAKSDGTVLHWRLFRPRPSRFGNVLPFFIDWQNTPHPSLFAPSGIALTQLDVATPLAMDLAPLLARIGVVNINVRHAAMAAITATLDTPKGRVTLI
jgi:hypothetical protein